MSEDPSHRARGRGTTANPSGRFERIVMEPDPEAPAGEAAARTECYADRTRSLITRNDSPDIPYTFSINPYRGCEHGCIYCYARPYHEYLGFSAGLDFETKILVKEDAPAILREELGRRSWKGDVLAMSGVTDPYQPVERRLRLTRQCLEVCAGHGQPVSVITKSGLVERDADVLAALARRNASEVALTITTLDEDLRRRLEPRAAAADVRFGAVAHLASHGIPVGVMVAPVIPGLTDHEIPRILSRAASAGAVYAGYQMLRLPHGVARLFEEWLAEHRPAAREKVLGRIRQVRGGCLTDGSFERRMRGNGALADLAERLFESARARAGLAAGPPPLSSESFRAPVARSRFSQPTLFDRKHHRAAGSQDPD